MFPPCSMPSWPTIYSLSWRLCPGPPRPPRASAVAAAGRAGHREYDAAGAPMHGALPRRYAAGIGGLVRLSTDAYSYFS